MNKFTEPAEKVLQDGRLYLDQQWESVKLRMVKGLSVGTSALARLLLLFSIVSVLLLTLSFALVMWLGELLSSYALGAFIVAGVLLLLFVVMFLLRDKLFKDAFIPLYSGIISPDRTENSQQELDRAIEASDALVEKQEAQMKSRFAELQDYYRPTRLLNEGLRFAGESAGKTGASIAAMVPAFWKLLFGRKKKNVKRVSQRASSNPK